MKKLKLLIVMVFALFGVMLTNNINAENTKSIKEMFPDPGFQECIIKAYGHNATPDTILPESFLNKDNYFKIECDAKNYVNPIKNVDGISNFKKLDSLSIISNSQPIMFSNEIAEIETLRGIVLRDIQNTTELSSYIGNITNLQFLYFENLDIKNFPKSFENLKKMSVIEIFDCKNIEEFPQQFLNMNELTIFIIRNSNISSIPEEFTKEKNDLIHFEVSNAKLTSLPNEIFLNNPNNDNIIFYAFDNNFISTIPTDAENFKGGVRLNNNKLSDLTERQFLYLYTSCDAKGQKNNKPIIEKSYVGEDFKFEGLTMYDYLKKYEYLVGFPTFEIIMPSGESKLIDLSNNFSKEITIPGHYLTEEGNYLLNIKFLNGFFANSVYSHTFTVQTNNLKLTLKGDNPLTINQFSKYIEPGYEAIDKVYGDLSKDVVISNKVNNNIPGTYIVEYTVTNQDNVTVKSQREVIVKEVKNSTLKIGDTTHYFEKKGNYYYNYKSVYKKGSKTIQWDNVYNSKKCKTTRAVNSCALIKKRTEKNGKVAIKTQSYTRNSSGTVTKFYQEQRNTKNKVTRKISKSLYKNKLVYVYNYAYSYRSNGKFAKQIKYSYKNGLKTNRLEYVHNKKGQLKSNKYGSAYYYKTYYSKGKATKTIKRKYTSKGKLGKIVKVKKRH